jgi:hypothetical protein
MWPRPHRTTAQVGLRLRLARRRGIHQSQPRSGSAICTQAGNTCQTAAARNQRQWVVTLTEYWEFRGEPSYGQMSWRYTVDDAANVIFLGNFGTHGVM